LFSTNRYGESQITAQVRVSELFENDLCPKIQVTEVTLVEMERQVIYNVLAGVWHGLVASEDASWLVVENRDTHLSDVEYNEIPEEQREEIGARLRKEVGP